MLTLLQQSWDTGGGAICKSVLRSARDVIAALPPLALANETQLSRLGVDSLEQVTNFLLDASLPSGGADVQGKLSSSNWTTFLRPYKTHILVDFLTIIVFSFFSNH